MSPNKLSGADDYFVGIEAILRESRALDKRLSDEQPTFAHPRSQYVLRLMNKHVSGEILSRAGR